LDTVVEKNLFMIRFKKFKNDGTLFAEVDGKKERIKQLSELSIKCTDVFLGYDNHTLIFLNKLEKLKPPKKMNISLQTLNNCLIV